MAVIKNWKRGKEQRYLEPRPPVVYCPFCGFEMCPVRNGYHFPQPYLFQHWEMSESMLESEYTIMDDFCPNNAAIFRVEADGRTLVKL